MIDAPTTVRAAGTPSAGVSDPEYAALLGIVPARAGIRSVAFAIDAVIWLALVSPAVIGGVLSVQSGPGPLALILLITGGAASTVFGFIQVLTHGRRGVTAGKASMRLRSVSVRDLGRPGFWRVVLRAFVLWCSGVVPVLGPALLLASGLWDPQRRGRSILDRVGGCWLVDTRAGIDPFDKKAMRHAERALSHQGDGLDEKLPSMATGAPADAAPRIPDERSRAGVVGPDGTGARWRTVADSAVLPLIDDVPVLANGSPKPLIDAVPPPRADPEPASLRRRSAPALRFDDGTVIRVPAAGLLGRNPEAAVGERVDTALDLDDPQMLLSKTHIAFGRDDDGVWVMDRGSRNGTSIQDPAGAITPAAAGERIRVPAGWAVHIGGRSFEVITRGPEQ